MTRSIPCAIAFVLLLTSFCFGLVTGDNHGDWPKDWPNEFEPLRTRAITYRVSAGNQEDMYEIPFTDQAEFERLWPFILELADPGGKLTLLSTQPDSRKTFFHTSSPAVLIFVPPSGVAMKPAGSDKYISPERDVLFDQDGHLPEYVVWDGEQWQGVRSLRRLRQFAYRTRVDLMLVVDGNVIDLNRIHLPEDVTIVDRRKLGATQPAEDEPIDVQDLPNLTWPYFSDLRPNGLE